jgi:hypothetical protein
LHLWKIDISFISVFHRILDFKTGLNFYSGPFFLLGGIPTKKAPE